MRRRNCGFAVSIVGLFLAFHYSCAPAVPKAGLSLESDGVKWVNKILAGMTIEAKVGQMICWRMTGKFFNDDSDTIKDLTDLIKSREIGGLILFLGEVYETAHLTNRLQTLSKIPLLIASDLERGTGNQISGATLFPPLMAMGAAGSEELAYEMGRITAIEARALGIHQTYAPVVDVNINPDNPIINTRSVGEAPDEVSRLTKAFIKGCQDNGLIATAKHFPGHGDTEQDSHSLLPTISGDLDRLNRIELYPFKKAIEAGVASIMTAHLHVPALDPTPGLPATLSPKILGDLLRNELGFRGILVTDAMNMGGVTNSFSAGEAAVKSIQAGVDMLLLPSDIRAAWDALVKAVKDGTIPESRINASVRRILDAKARLGLNHDRMVDIKALTQKIGKKEYERQAALSFESAITLVKNEREILPLAKSGIKLSLFALSSDAGEYFAGKPFAIEVQKRLPDAMVFYAAPDTAKEIFEEAKAKTAGASQVVFALFSTVRANKGSVGIEPAHVQLIHDVASTGVPVIVISFGSPYLLRNFPEVPAYFCAYRNAPAAQEAAAKALFGEIEIKGKLPVSIPGLYPLGHGLLLPIK